MAFVEGALARTAPGPEFAVGVVDALPALLVASLASTGAAAKGAARVGGKLATVLGALVGPILGFLGAWSSYRSATPSPFLEYRSPVRLLGLPLVHVRLCTPAGEPVLLAVGWVGAPAAEPRLPADPARRPAPLAARPPRWTALKVLDASRALWSWLVEPGNGLRASVSRCAMAVFSAS